MEKEEEEKWKKKRKTYACAHFSCPRSPKTWDGGRVHSVSRYGCDGVPVDTLYDVHNKILLALKKNVVKKASFSAIAEEKEDHRSSTKVCMLFGSVWCLKDCEKTVLGRRRDRATVIRPAGRAVAGRGEQAVAVAVAFSGVEILGGVTSVEAPCRGVLHQLEVLSFSGSSSVELSLPIGPQDFVDVCTGLR